MKERRVGMDDNADSVEEKIILAAIDCIDKHGISGTTNRLIAQIAGINSAAINYYFRGKDVLIRRCMETTLKNAFDLSDMPAMPGAGPQERCVAVLLDLVEGGFRYPGITRAHFFNLVAEGRENQLLSDWVGRFCDDLAADLRSRGSSLAEDELKLALAQILSAVFMAILAPSLFKPQYGADMHDVKSRSVYVTRLVAGLLA
jgi:AcrR family transcriptional regulator